MLLLSILTSLAAIVLSQDSNLSELPLCAQGCLGNATDHQGECSNVDLKCLCSNVEYVNVLACCISTKCSDDDQKKAVSFNSQLCAGVNITIPNFIGCAEVTSTSTGAKTSRASSGQTGLSTRSPTSTIGKLGAAVTLPNNPPLAQFTGEFLFQGSCTSPQFASVTVNSGAILEYPWVGCSNENPGCCPFDIHVGGSLSICPNDYTTTGTGCCPSGWSVYTTAFAGQTPCYTNPPSPLIPATISATNGVSISVINTKLFSLQYALQRKKTGLSTGATAGVAVGAILGVLAFLSLIFFLVRKRRQTKHEIPLDAAGAYSEGTSVGDKRNSTFSQAYTPSTHIPQPLNPTTPVTSPPVEMQGSTFINEHHPAFTPTENRDGFLLPPESSIVSRSGTPGGVVSPPQTPAYR